MSTSDRSFWVGVAAGAALGVAAASGAIALALSRPSALSGKTREERMVRHVFATAREGDAASVLAAIDDFCYKQTWLMNVGDVKGRIVRDELERAKPRTVLEFGGYMGYSAILIGSLLPEGAQLISIEINAVYAALATKLIEFAGLRDRVRVVVRDVASALPQLTKELGPGSVDFVFIDHWKERYLPDLHALESSGLCRPGSVLVADNILYPGAPDYLAYVQTSPAYQTKLYEATLEYQPWVKDAVAVSVVV